jgi:teichoic acid transport system ATP-binding protein
MGEYAIVANHLQKAYRIYEKKSDQYLDFFLPMSFGRNFFALNDISFAVERGESVGLVGLNGSGKSTLSNIIAGSSAPTGGTIETEGEISMTAISGGINPMLTGRENIMQKGLLLGLDSRTIQELMPEIIEFSELGPFIEQQAKTYSSGMKSKLAFSISVHIDPDIMVIDEALSVGDPTFTKKCLMKMREFRTHGKTIVFVSHSVDQIRDFCDKAIWLEGGKVRQVGPCEEVLAGYQDFIQHYNKLPKEEQDAFRMALRAEQWRDAT